MSEKIVTQAAKHSEELLTATENLLRSHNLRLKPGVTLEHVIDGLAENQITLTAQNGYAQASMKSTIGTDLPVHVPQAIEGLAEKKSELFFPRAVDNIESKAELDQEGRIKFIRERGLSEWEKLPMTAPQSRTVVLDATRLNRKDWLALDVKTRAQLSGQWGRAVIGQIMNRVR